MLFIVLAIFFWVNKSWVSSAVTLAATVIDGAVTTWVWARYKHVERKTEEAKTKAHSCVNDLNDEELRDQFTGI